MVNAGVTDTSWAEVERRLVLAHTPVDRRPALAALLALDDTLADILRSTRQPMVGQMRLTWWHDALSALDTAPAPAQPVLRDLAGHLLPRGVTGANLAGLVEGWEELLDPDDLTDAALDRYAAARGGRAFAIAGQVLGAAATDPLAAAGQGWALADLARHSREGARAKAAAAPLLARATGVRWSRGARPIGMMAHLAALPDDATPARRAFTLWRHRLTGR